MRAIPVAGTFGGFGFGRRGSFAQRVVGVRVLRSRAPGVDPPVLPAPERGAAGQAREGPRPLPHVLLPERAQRRAALGRGGRRGAAGKRAGEDAPGGERHRGGVPAMDAPGDERRRRGGRGRVNEETIFLEAIARVVYARAGGGSSFSYSSRRYCITKESVTLRRSRASPCLFVASASRTSSRRAPSSSASVPAGAGG